MTRLKRLQAEANKRGVVQPSPVTLGKYGWTLEDWLGQLEGNRWRCPICLRAPRTGKYVTDHEHVRGWAKMPDEERKLYVRGLTCWSCNRYLLARDISVATAHNVVCYLETYAARRPK